MMEVIMDAAVLFGLSLSFAALMETIPLVPVVPAMIMTIATV